MPAQGGFENGHLAALLIAGLFTVACLVLAWLEHRDGRHDKPRDDRDQPEP